MNMKPHVSIAPMMDWTDRHCRYFHRLIAPDIRLFTEMVTTGALLHGDRDRFLRFNAEEHPVALQLGGSEPDDLAQCARMAEDYGYDEINLNCGCPSERVQKGAFGACLMREPALVGECIAAMKNAVRIPVTIKCRIGIDDSEDYVFLEDFVKRTMDAGCDTFILHARKAWLKGLSPKENREVPPLRYDIVGRLKQDYPHLTVILNGGVATVEDIRAHLITLDGVMIGREPYHNPWFLHEIERGIFSRPADDLPAREAIVRAMIPYAAHQMETYGTPVKSITRHMLGLFNGLRGSRGWRRILSTEVSDLYTPPQILEKALSAVVSGQ